MAKEVLKKYLGKELPEDEYEVIELDRRNDGGAIQDYLRQITGARTVSLLPSFISILLCYVWII